MANLEVDELLQWVITLPAQQRASDRSLNSDGCKRNPQAAPQAGGNDWSSERRRKSCTNTSASPVEGVPRKTGNRLRRKKLLGDCSRAG